MLILHATTGIFCLVSVEVVMALTLHMPGTLDLIIKGVLAGGFFGLSCIVCNEPTKCDNSYNGKYDDLFHRVSFWNKT